jgi:predicted XRE-type DNA-binding protein
MGRSLDQVIADLPPERRNGVEARYQELKREIEGLRELREIAGKAQVEIAAALHIKQPSVSKIEKQADMYLSTLRSYVEAVGGKLELTVRLPAHPAFTLHNLGDVVAGDVHASKPRRRQPKRAAARSRPSRQARAAAK